MVRRLSFTALSLLAFSGVPLVAGVAETPSPHTFDADPYAPARGTTFEVVPGKHSPWSFTIEPYGWLPGLTGDVGVKGLPATHVDYSPKTLLSNLRWGAFLKGEARYGRWGILGDGMFVDIQASADTPGPLYNSATLTVQQGLAQLAVAYRVWEDYRGFVDLYAGARYNYLGVNLGASVDDSGVSQVGTDITERISHQIRTAADDYVTQRATAISQQVAAAAAGVQASIQPRIASLQRQISRAIQSGQAADIAQLQAAQDALISRTTSTVEAGQKQIEDLRVQAQQAVRSSATDAVVTRWADVPREVRKLEDKRELERILSPRHKEFVSLVQAQASQQAALIRKQVAAQLQDQLIGIAAQRLEASQKVLEKSLRQGSKQDQAAARRLVASANSQLAGAQSRKAATLAAADGQAAEAEKAVAKAQKKLAKKIADQLEESLPTSGESDVWWVDPIVGIRAQVNLTRWLFLATQCDVGGFGAGSQIAWNLNATVGVNWTRNLFTELGYRYYYVDYQKSGLTYEMAEAGLFMGLGVKF